MYRSLIEFLNVIKPFANTPKHKMSSDQYKSNWFRGDKLHFKFLYYVQHLTLTFHFTLRSMVIKHRVIQDIIYYREGFNTTIFKLTLNEMFLSCAVYCFCFQIPFRFWFQFEFDCHQIISDSLPYGFRLEIDFHQIISDSVPFSITIGSRGDLMRDFKFHRGNDHQIKKLLIVK